MPYGTVNADLMTTSDGVSSSGLYGFKNRIINGAMVIDQRNAGASGTPTSSGYSLDRWNLSLSVASKFSFQQSTTAPTGFSNSLLFTSLSSYSVGAGDLFLANQWIEGFNTADLMWGTANAKTVTLSFWVRSSLTGTFGGALNNGSSDRTYPFSYTISSANTFEYKTVTIAGDTSGTWLTTNGRGLGVWFSLGAGSTYSGTAGAWASANVYQPTGATSVVGTNGATFYITGVQLEKGSTATSFDYRPYGTELQLCQRYYEIIAPVQSSFLISVNATGASQEFEFLVKYLVLKRTTPTVTRVGTWTDSNSSGVTPVVVGSDLFSLALFSNASGRCYTYNNGSSNASFTVSAEL
jgi:hypothetical protein